MSKQLVRAGIQTN